MPITTLRQGDDREGTQYHALPKEAWVEGYYDILEPRAKALVDHPDSSVRDFAVETIKEIETFNRSEDSYGYVFYVLQRA